MFRSNSYSTLLGSNRNCISSDRNLFGAGIETVITNNQGVNSYCTVDENKFIKYYFELNNEKLYNTPLWIVIDKSKMKCKRMNELDMLTYVNEHISPSPCPKVYTEESHDIEFDENIFNSIRSHIWYEPSKIQLKRLVIEYIHGSTLQQYLIDNGLIVNTEKRTIEANNVPKQIMIEVYRTWFELLLNFFDENIIPDDLDNMSNILIPANGKFQMIAIDCSIWLLMRERHVHVLNEDLLYNFIWFIFWRHRRNSLDIIIALQLHNDWDEILKEALKDLIPENMYERLRNDFFAKDRDYVKMKQQITMFLCGDNSKSSVDSYELFDMYVSDNQKYVSMTNHANEIIKELPFDISSTVDGKVLHQCWEFVYSKCLPLAEQSYIFLHAKQYCSNTPDKIIDNVRYLIESVESSNETLTLYPIGDSKCFFTTKNNNSRSIRTNRYFPLVKSNNGCSVKSKYFGGSEIDERFFYDGFFTTDVELRDIIYVVLESGL